MIFWPPSNHAGAVASQIRRKAFPLLAILLAALILTSGCKREASKADARSAEEVWQQAEWALSTGNAKAAAALFAESLELDGQVQQYRSAAIALAGAGHLDLSESILAGCQEPQLAALREAIRSYRQSAPPGYEKDAHVVAAMGDALSVVAAAKDPIVELAQPLTFARQDLLLAAHYWQAWMCCRAALAETDLTGRQMIVWRWNKSRPRSPAAASFKPTLNPPARLCWFTRVLGPPAWEAWRACRMKRRRSGRS